MGLLFSCIRLFSAASAAQLLFKKMVDAVLDAQQKINKIEEFANASLETEGDSVLELLAFAYFAASNLMVKKSRGAQNSKDTLKYLYEKIIADIAHHRNPRLKYHMFHDYFNQVFAEHCEAYEKYNLNVENRRRTVAIVTGKISRIYGKCDNNQIIAIADNLLKEISRVIS